MRPGRKPRNLRKLDIKLELDTDDDGRRVRDAGGGPWIRSLIYAALGRAPEQEPITTELENREDTVDLRVRVPRSRLQQPGSSE